VRVRIVTSTIQTGIVPFTADYTHADITTWSTKGVALFFVSGDSAAEAEGGRISIGMCDQAGNQEMSCTRLLNGRPTVSECINGNDRAAVIRVMDDTPVSSADTWARAEFDTALSNGVRLNWLDVSGVSGRTFNIVCVLIDGLTDCEVGDGSGASAPGFEPDAVIGLGFNGSIAAESENTDGHVTLGGAVDGSPIKQAAIVTAWNSAVDSQSAGIARDDCYALDFSPQASQTEQTLTDFTATGFDDAGLGGVMWAALLPDDDEPFGVALETLSGTGAQSFTGLGISSQVVIGVINGNANSNTIETDTDQLSCLGLFVTDGTNTYSMSLAQTREAIGGGNNSDAFSRYTSGSINVLSHTGGTLFEATVTGVSGGLQLNITTGFTGRMFLFGFGLGDQVLVHNETVQISEGSVLLQQLVLVINETIQISEGDVVFQEQDAQTDPDQRMGKTYQGGARYGRTVQGGATLGDTAS
jgi:hypothetical protein